MASLDSRIRDINRAKIAKHIVNWKELAPYLGLSAAEQKVVEKGGGSYLQQACEAIQKWQQKNGDDANYGAFIEVATEADNKELADYWLWVPATNNSAVIQKKRDFVSHCRNIIRSLTIVYWSMFQVSLVMALTKELKEKETMLQAKVSAAQVCTVCA